MLEASFPLPDRSLVHAHQGGDIGRDYAVGHQQQSLPSEQNSLLHRRRPQQGEHLAPLFSRQRERHRPGPGCARPAQGVESIMPSHVDRSGKPGQFSDERH
jgi:hypothetical protein